MSHPANRTVARLLPSGGGDVGAGVATGGNFPYRRLAYHDATAPTTRRPLRHPLFRQASRPTASLPGPIPPIVGIALASPLQPATRRSLKSPALPTPPLNRRPLQALRLQNCSASAKSDPVTPTCRRGFVWLAISPHFFSPYLPETSPYLPENSPLAAQINTWGRGSLGLEIRPSLGPVSPPVLSGGPTALYM